MPPSVPPPDTRPHARKIGKSHAACASQPALRQMAGFLIAGVVGGIVVVYAIGMPWLSFITGTPFDKVVTGSVVFLPGDILKAVIASLAARAVMVGYPLLPQRA